jgi:hypothetical protein
MAWAPNQPCATNIAIVVLIAAAVIYYCVRCRHRRRDGFVSHRAQEVHHSSQALFDRTGGSASYSEYKTTLSTADPVIYTDTRRLWKEGRLTPEEVEKIV